VYDEHIEKIRLLPVQIEELVNGLTDEQLTTPYLDGEWTVAQNVHHLVDSHFHSYIRCKRIMTEDRPLLKGYDQDAWAELPEAKSADLSYSLTTLLGLDAHTAVAIISSIIAIAGIALAFLLFGVNRNLGRSLGAATRPIGYVFEHGYFLDAAYNKLIVAPLRVKAHVITAFDQLVIDWAVRLIGLLPAGVGLGLRKLQTGHLQGYGIGMVAGIALLAALIFFLTPR